MPSNINRKSPGKSILDRIDIEILAALQNNARLSNKELAAEVGLAPSSCLERVRRLRSSGVVRGFHADVDPLHLGIGIQAISSVRLARHAREHLSSFFDAVFALPEVIAVYQLAGADDFFVHIAVRDAEHLRDFVLDRLTTREEVSHLETALVFKYDRKTSLPSYA